MTEHKNYQ